MEVSQGGERIEGDALALKLRSIAHGILTLVFGLLPIIFIPLPAAGLEQTKVVVVVFALAFALIFYSLSVLRSGSVTGSFPLTFLAFWAIVIVAGVSVVFSGDLMDGLIGDTLGIHTAGFLLVLALTMTIWMFVGMTKASIMRLFLLFIGSTVLLTLFQILRLVFGADFLSFGVFTDSVSSPIGGWNDLALFLGLIILLALVTFEQLPLTKWSRIIFGLVVVASLVMLAVINFFFVWLVLGVVSLVLVVYSLGKDRFGDKTLFAKRDRSITSLLVPTVVCVVSFLFVLGGSLFGGMINGATGISYLEVRPSFSATIDIARGVYHESAFLGMGTNRFSDAWRLHKDRSINETIFWNTDFESGNGYIPSFFVTNGVLGGIAWLIFIGLLTIAGIRTLLRSSESDRIWYFIATTAFVGAVFIWGMSLVYVPGPVILLIGALCVGVLFLAGNALNPERTKTISLAVNRRSGFVLTLIVMAVIMGSVAVMYGAGRHYASVFTFLKSIDASQPGADLDTIEGFIAQADELFPNDLYARRIAEYQLARMGVLLEVTEPSEAERQQFQTAVGNGVAAARLATERDAADPQNWATLGAIYSALVATLPSTETAQIYDLAKQSLEEAKKLDPMNPSRFLALAELELRKGNTEAALGAARESISYKSNYGDGIFFLSQLHILMGNVKEAIASTQAMINLEPQNPLRYYQLGVLHFSSEDFGAAAAVFEDAVRLDANYANARYFLALAYSKLGRTADARRELEQVLALNPGNEFVAGLLEELNETGTISLSSSETSSSVQPVGEEETVSQNLDDVTTTKDPETPLVSPVNTPAGSSATGTDGAAE